MESPQLLTGVSERIIKSKKVSKEIVTKIEMMLKEIGTGNVV